MSLSPDGEFGFEPDELGKNPVDQSQTFRRQADLQATSVMRIREPDNELVRFEPIEPAGQARAAKKQRAGDLPGRERVRLTDSAQCREHIENAARDAVVCHQPFDARRGQPIDVRERDEHSKRPEIEPAPSASTIAPTRSRSNPAASSLRRRRVLLSPFEVPLVASVGHSLRSCIVHEAAFYGAAR